MNTKKKIFIMSNNKLNKQEQKTLQKVEIWKLHLCVLD